VAERATALLEAARRYHQLHRWHCRLLLLMPDHVHALLAFPAEPGMSRIVGAWKSFTAKRLGIAWQSNFFDHRIRHAAELEEKAAYIAANPVAKQLCARPEEWPWVCRGDP